MPLAETTPRRRPRSSGRPSGAARSMGRGRPPGGRSPTACLRRRSPSGVAARSGRDARVRRPARSAYRAEICSSATGEVWVAALEQIPARGTSLRHCCPGSESVPSGWLPSIAMKKNTVFSVMSRGKRKVLSTWSFGRSRTHRKGPAETGDSRTAAKEVPSVEYHPRTMSETSERSDASATVTADGDAVTMEKIVALCKRRGFVFPSSEIYGGVGSTYDYGHYGVLLKNNVKNEWWRAMLQERDDIVAIDSAILQHPRVWEASGHLAGFTDPLVDCRTCGQRFRADHLEELPCGRKPSKHPGETDECDLTEARDFNLMFETTIGPVKESGVDRLPAPGDGAGHLHQLQERPAVLAQEAAVRDRPGRQVLPQRDHARQLHLPHARVRADGDGVLRAAGRGRSSWFEHWLAERERWYVELGIRPDHLRLRPHEPDELSHYSSGTSDVEYLFPIGWSELEGIANRGDFDLTQHAEFSGEKLEYFDQAHRRALRAARDRAGGRRRPRDARVPRRRLRRGTGGARGRGRGRDAHGAAPAPAPGAGQGRGAAARRQGRPARARARGLRSGARARAVRVRRRRRDRQALPPPG